MSEYQDQQITCREDGCGQTFIHTAGEQEWMRSKWGDDYNPPVRCKACRSKRREQKMNSQRDHRPLHD